MIHMFVLLLVWWTGLMASAIDGEHIDGCDPTSYHSDICHPDGVWLPELPPLFKPLLANPREVITSGSWRFDDDALVHDVVGVSFGEMIPVYRWFHVWPVDGQFECDIQGGLWAVFDPLHESAPLINADYYIGFPLMAAFDSWSFRLRIYHISSHLGDEFLLNHPGFDRKNPSAQYMDCFVAKQFTNWLRVYGGVGVVLSQDASFYVGNTYEAAGVEIHFWEYGFYKKSSTLYGTPYYAMHFYHQNNYHNIIDMTYVVGYEFGKMCGLCRKVRFFVEFHDGYSPDGQFAHIRDQYLSLNISYGF